MRVILTILTLSVALAGCADASRVQAPASNSGTCLALALAMPVKYHGDTVDAESKANVQKANAAFRAACPGFVK